MEKNYSLPQDILQGALSLSRRKHKDLYNMVEALERFASRYSKFTETEWQAMVKRVKHRVLKKNEVLIAEGDIPKEIAFTNKGYLRLFYKHKNKEITRDISLIHTFLTALPGFIHNKPSYEVVSAATDCELLIISKKDLHFLYETYPAWERFGRRIMEEMYVNLQDRLYEFITLSAEERYLNLMRKSPDILLNVPLQYIASYLGVTQQSLSRLRKMI